MNEISRTQNTDKRNYGVIKAIVIDAIDISGQGRVKIQFPGPDGEIQTELGEVSQFYAGNGYGAFFLPEAGDEVLVAFVQGDLRQPVILGSLYNGKDKPPTNGSSSQDQKVIRTSGQHELLFDDTPNGQRVRIMTSGGHQVDLSDADKKITVQSSGGQTVVMDDESSKISVQSGGCTVEIDSSGTLKLTGAKIELNAPVVSLGDNSSEHPLVWGDQLLTWLNTHVHSCSLPSSPTSPPIVPAPQSMLSGNSLTS